MAVNRRQKGNRGEKMAASVIMKWTKKKFMRAETNNSIHMITADNSKGDIICKTEGHYWPFCTEVKFYEDLNFQHLLYLPNPKILDFWNQCTNDAKRCNKCPLLMMRYNGLPKDFFFVAIPLKIYYLYFAKALKRSITFQIDALGIVIFTSSDLLKIPYKEIRKEIRNLYKK